MSEYIGGLSEPLNLYAYRCTKCKTVALLSKEQHKVVMKAHPFLHAEPGCGGVLSYEGPTTTCERKR